MVNKAQREFDSEADDLPNTATCFDALQVLQQSIKPLGACRKHNNIINYFTTSDKDDEKIIYKKYYFEVTNPSEIFSIRFTP